MREMTGPTRSSRTVSRGTGRASGALAVVAVVALAVAAGCGGDDGVSPAETPVTTEPTPDDDAGEEPAGAEPDVGVDDDPGDEAPGPVMLEVRDAWVRMPAMGQTVAAAYLTFVNPGDVDVRVTSVSSSLATAELHETVTDDEGVMRMEHRRDGFVVPAADELVLEPGGLHVMLIHIDRLDLQMRDETELTFTLESADEPAATGEIVVDAEIRRDAGPSHGHGSGHGHSEDAGGVRHHDPVLGLDADALHALDDELHGGTFEPERQRGIVADALAAIEHTDVPAGFDVDELVAALVALDAALAAGDVDASADLAFRVHGLGHAVVPHGHGHSHDHSHGH